MASQADKPLPGRALLICAFALALLLAACGTIPTGISAPTPSTAAATATAATATSATGPIVGTAVPVELTSLPATGTHPLPPTVVPATPIPPLPAGASPTELKYGVLDQFPNLFFCDPDYYPVARSDETDLARQHWPELQANTEEFQTILKHTGLEGLAVFTDEQKLLVYREHKRLAAVQFELAGDQYRFQLQIVDQSDQGWIVTGLVDGSGAITVQDRKANIASCPRCLAAQTWIDTPRGPVAVEDLRAGDTVWTVDAAGIRRPAPILATARTPVPAGHLLVHVALGDGRELWASPGHPTTTGQPLGELHPGDPLDGARVVHVAFVSYGRPATYDLLPAGDTGFYWANGILIGSTLRMAP